VATKKKPAPQGKTRKRKAPAKAPPRKTKTRVTEAQRKKPVAGKKKTARKPVAKKAVAQKAKHRAKTTPKPLGFPEQQRDAALKILDDRQAEQIVAVDVRRRSAMADYVIVASGRSGRQLAALADYLRKTFETLGVRKIRVEGLPQGDWVLVDAGDVVVHLFRPEVRRYYNIEDLWNPRFGG
jgi:ribosome-associated protein